MNDLVGASVLIAGYGREGRSALNYLHTHNPDLKLTVADQNLTNLDVPGVSLISGPGYLQTVDQFDTVIRSPGIPKTTPALLKAKHLTSVTNLFFGNCPGQIIGITGTKGKSTTSALIHQILSTAHQDSRLVGNIGQPALNELTGANGQTLFVTELSSFQLDDIRYSPHVAVVLPISEEHLNYHQTFQAYIEAKGHIVDHQMADDFVIYAPTNVYSRTIAQKSRGQMIPFGQPEAQPVAVWFQAGQIWVKTATLSSQALINRSEIPLLGIANVGNVMAAVTVALVLEVDLPYIRQAIKTFKPLEHRLEPVGTYRGIQFYNDSLATTPVATIHALEALGDKVTTLIAGGYDRGLSFTVLGDVVRASSIQHLLLFPDTGREIEAAINSKSLSQPLTFQPVQTMEEAVRESYRLTPPGGICLMSPASASFNLFKDYADRGSSFKKWVKEIGTSPPKL